MIRNVLLSSATLAALTVASFAADLPSRKAPATYAPAPIFTWTGFYVGADIGGGWTIDTGRIRNAAGVPQGTENLGASGVVGGLYAGYNYQVSNAFVLGLEVDIDATSISQTSNTNTFQGPNVNADKESLPWQGSLRGRLGYAISNVLLYATGGLAFAQINTSYTTIAAPASQASFSGMRAGWMVGGGLEYAFDTNWIGRFEYRYSKFSPFTDGVPNGIGNGLGGLNVRHSVSENAVRVGIAYTFGAPALAVVAKY